MKQTKIVCSISDFRCDTEFLRHLFFAGMNVVRMNTAHATEEGMRNVIKNVRSVSPHIGILIDTKGPEVRTTAVASPMIFGRPEMETTHDIINVSYPDFCNDVKVGDHVLFDDGALDLTVMENIGPMIVARVENDGTLGSKKSVNVPGEHIDLPALTEKDRKNILFAIEQDIDFIAHSFVRSASDVHAIQEILDEHHSDIKIISKIENQEGVDNFDEIIEASYGIMIARGDLRKPVIVATQMLHSMINNPRPTRAEVTDIANAIYMRTDALMLSGETATGKYPVEAVETMSTIAEQAEKDRQRLNGFELPLSENCSQKEFLAHAAIDSTRRLGVAGIIADSMTGEVVRYLASFRGPKPILAICYREKTQRLLNLSYGVIPIYQHDSKSPEYIFLAALRMLRQKGYVDLDDKIAYLSGNLGLAAGTTFLEINPVRRVFENIDFFHLPQYAEQRIE